MTKGGPGVDGVDALMRRMRAGAESALRPLFSIGNVAIVIGSAEMLTPPGPGGTPGVTRIRAESLVMHRCVDLAENSFA